MWAVGGLSLGLLIAFGFILRDHFQADSMALVYRDARAPLIQYRLEKGAWPAKFDFRVPPADLAAWRRARLSSLGEKRRSSSGGGRSGGGRKGVSDRNRLIFLSDLGQLSQIEIDIFFLGRLGPCA
jgi:hypothetical protein